MNKLRFLVALSVAQAFSLIALLVGRGDEQPASIEPRLRQIAASALASCSNAVTERRLRSILREEFARQLQARTNQHGAATAALEMQPPDAAEDRRRQELVAQQVETYISVGSITEQQILDLQAQMAPLDAKTRTKVMSRLMQAVNSGDLDAQF